MKDSNEKEGEKSGSRWLDPKSTHFRRARTYTHNLKTRKNTVFKSVTADIGRNLPEVVPGTEPREKIRE